MTLSAAPPCLTNPMNNKIPLVCGGQGRHAREALASATALVWCLAGAAILAVYIAYKVLA